MSVQAGHGEQVRAGGRIEWVCRQTGWIAGSLAVITTLGLDREVVVRYFFNSPTTGPWT